MKKHLPADKQEKFKIQSSKSLPCRQAGKINPNFPATRDPAKFLILVRDKIPN